MRKILTSVLSVAGLLAVVLALATSPASAARSVVTFETAESGTATAGVYTVSWDTAGGCDPGAGTSGASGSVTITVGATNDGTPAPGGGLVAVSLIGNQGRDFVTVNDDCTYEWSVSFVDAASKGSCAITIADDELTGESNTGGSDGTVTLANPAVTDCAPATIITVTVADASDGEDDPDTDDVETNDGVSGGAIKETTFTATATPVRNSDEVCQAVSGETELNDAKVPQVKLAVVGDSAIVKGAVDVVACRYTVTVAVPDGFAAPGKSNIVGNVSPRTAVEADAGHGHRGGHGDHREPGCCVERQP